MFSTGVSLSCLLLSTTTTYDRLFECRENMIRKLVIMVAPLDCSLEIVLLSYQIVSRSLTWEIFADKRKSALVSTLNEHHFNFFTQCS
jgi:hypothetical protein